MKQQVQDWRQLPVILIWLTHGWIAGLRHYITFSYA